MSLRPATPDDLPAVLAIEATAQPAPWNREHFESELGKPHSHFLVLTDDDTDTTILGYIVYWVLDDVTIATVAVNADYRGLGYGKVLVRQAVREGIQLGAKKVQLEVRTQNQAAVQLYHSIGFMILHVRKKFYSNGDDAYVMELALEGDRVDF